MASLEASLLAATKLFISNQKLNALAKILHPHNKVVRVPGDGWCLFHAIIVAMRAQGIYRNVCDVKMETVACLNRAGLVELAKAVDRNDYAAYDERVLYALAYSQALNLRVVVDNDENCVYNDYTAAGAMANWVSLPPIARESAMTVVIVNRLNASPLHFDAVTRDGGGAAPLVAAADVEAADSDSDSDSNSRRRSSSGSGGGAAADDYAVKLPYLSKLILKF
jgi:hypothetical protein